MRSLIALAACALICTVASGQQYHIPANNEVAPNARNGTAAGREALALISTANATLPGLAELLLASHDAAEYGGYAAYAGQQSATLASVAAAGATLLGGTVALNNATASVAEATAALSAAEGLIDRIVDENAVNNTNATNANLLLASSIAHDGTLAQYWQNETGGVANDNVTFAATVEFAAELPEAAATQLELGASQALVTIAAEITARNLLSAIYTYQGNDTLAFAEGLAEARLLLKTANVLQNAAVCAEVNATASLAEANTAVEAATKASESLTAADIDAARTAALTVVNTANRCASVAPTLAPAASAASLGRRLL